MKDDDKESSCCSRSMVLTREIERLRSMLDCAHRPKAYVCVCGDDECPLS